MEQQKALVAAAMRSTSQPGTPTANSSCDPLRFTGLPEFDETQIPELAAFGADMEGKNGMNIPNAYSFILTFIHALSSIESGFFGTWAPKLPLGFGCLCRMSLAGECENVRGAVRHGGLFERPERGTRTAVEQ